MPWARNFCPFRAYWIISSVQVNIVLVVFPTQQAVLTLPGHLLDDRAIGVPAEDDPVARGLAESASIRTVAD